MLSIIRSSTIISRNTVLGYLLKQNELRPYDLEYATFVFSGFEQQTN
jgi:hypothetical protein